MVTVTALNYLFLNIFFACTIQSDGKKYCNTSICKNNKDLCKFQQSEAPARHCVDLENLVKSDEDKRALLDKINSRRSKIAAGELRSYPAAANMMKLEWNPKLEQSAQRWAKQCVRHSSPDIRDACRDSEGVKVGQNIASVYGESPGLQVTSLVDVWYMELLNNNASILKRFREWNEAGPQYEYFTQLVWADSNEVGCGGVKFKERFEEIEERKNRTVYRLVCNFAPSGNSENHPVYIQGVPCSKCPQGTVCDGHYKSLCSKIVHQVQKTLNKTAALIELEKDIPKNENMESTTVTTVAAEDTENYTLFDYFSHLHDYTKQTITATTSHTPECKDMLAVDNFIELLKKRLSTDHIFKELLAPKSTPGILEINFTDANVAAFAKRIYSKKGPPPIMKSTANEYVNSTLLVDLVEAVIFRNSDKPATLPLDESTLYYTVSAVMPVKIQAELGALQENEDFTGHYFFPEEEDGNNKTEATEFYYDNTSPSLADILHEIEDLKRMTVTKNFLDDILESESSEPTTRTTMPSTVPSVYLNMHKPGHEIMKKFLEDIKEKSEM